MSSEGALLKVTNLGKRYEIYASPRDRLKQFLAPALHRAVGWLPGLDGAGTKLFYREFWALRGVNFELEHGEALGIIGLNGSGKSTLLQLICSTLTPTEGEVDVKGRLAALLELGSGFNPEFTGRENALLNAQLLGLSLAEATERFPAIEEFAGIGDFMDQPIKTYSSGMVLRLAFAVATNVEPEILVIDEALAVGDVGFQRKCLRQVEHFCAGGGLFLFVSHSPEQVRRVCRKALYLKNGQLAGYGDAKTICGMYERDVHKSNALVTKTAAPTAAGPKHLTPKIETAEEAVASSWAECALSYGTGQASITSVWIENSSHEKTNQISVDEAFHWCFAIEFHSDYSNITFGYSIKTKEGIIVNAANTKSLGLEARPFNKDERIVVQFTIDSHLACGEYILSCGVSTWNGVDDIFLARIVDASILTVSGQGCGIGLVNMQVRFDLQQQD